MINRRQFIQHSTAAIAVAFAPSWSLGLDKPTGQWRRLADMPYPVQEIYPALVDSFIHVAGGFTPAAGKAVPTARHIQYSIADNQWRELASLPEVRHHPQLINADGELYALGGFKADEQGDWVMQGQTWRYDPRQDLWLDDVPAPEVHGESVCLPLAEHIHIIGGRTPSGSRNAHWQDHGDSNRHLIFDTKTKTWQRAAPALQPRNSAAGAVINGLLYVVGGRTVSGGNVAHLEIYDPREDRWRSAAPLPQAQGGLAAAAINRQLVAFGGELLSAKGFGVLADAWCYDPATDRWSALSPMATPRHGLGAVSDGNNIYAIGGAIKPATGGTSQVLDALTFTRANTAPQE